MRGFKYSFVICFIALLVACGTPKAPNSAASRGQEASEGLVFEVDARRQSVKLLESGKRDLRTTKGPRIWQPGKDINVKKLEAKFDRKGGLTLSLRLENITKDAVFSPPFDIKARSNVDELVQIKLPEFSKERLFDKERLSPKEAVDMQFDIAYTRETFLLYIDISSILTILDPNTFLVNSTLDLVDTNPGDGVCGFIFTWKGSTTRYCTLRAAINEVNALAKFPTKTIKVPEGNYSLSQGRLKVLNSMTIKGDGVSKTIIDGAGASGVMQIGKYDGSEAENDILVNLRDLTLQNGDTGISGAGGGLRIEEHTYVQMSGCQIRDNEAGLAGGGIANAGTLRMTECTVSGNKTSAAGFAASGGGGIASFSTGNVKLTRSTVSGNEAPWGGGISNDGKFDLLSSTVSGNKARGGGGGILNDDGYLNISFSTITLNEANADKDYFDEQATGGGIRNNPSNVATQGHINMANTILANNKDNRSYISTYSGTTTPYPHGSPDCYSVTPYRFTSLRGNLVGILTSNCDLRDTLYGAPPNFMQYGTYSNEGKDPLNPKLGPLTDNGGPTKTHKPYWNSPAVDKGAGVTSSPLSDCPDKDQRGLPRPVDGDSNGTAKCDVGAVERQ